jgi:putative Holliday junction resolvase
MVVIGVDFGMRHIGVSVGDTISKQARPLTSFSWSGVSGYLDHLAPIVERWCPEQLVVGMPLNVDGTMQAMSSHVQAFIKACEAKFAIPVSTADERWSTVSAKAHLFEVNKHQSVKKHHIDAESACVILSQWLIECA